MNQKYLLGIAGDSQEKEIFVASAENVAAFICKHQNPYKLCIGTLDGKVLLVAKAGLIECCPDQEYLQTKLLPVLVPMQMGKRPVAQLKLANEAAKGYNCPQPDWNFLRWTGYSDARYKALMKPDGLITLKINGEKQPLELKVATYRKGHNLAIEMLSWRHGYPQTMNLPTVDINEKLKKNCAFIDVNNNGSEILHWIEQSGLAKPTGRVAHNGFCVYPEYEFDERKLKALDPEGYDRYVKSLNGPSKKQPHHDGPER